MDATEVRKEVELDWPVSVDSAWHCALVALGEHIRRIWDTSGSAMLLQPVEDPVGLVSESPAP